MFDGEMFHIDFDALTGSPVTVYGQSEVMKDVFDAGDERGLKIVFEAEDVRPNEVESGRPFVTYRKNGAVRAGRVRFHRRVRRLARGQPHGDSAGEADAVRAAATRSAGSGSWPTCRRFSTS